MNQEKRIIRNWLWFFIIVLLLSGLSAILIECELNFLISNFPFEGSIKGWLEEVLNGIKQISEDYPFLFYGFDWLAYAHFVLAVLFIGPIRNPVKNIWVIEFGIIACSFIIPYAMVAGHFREIPLWWRLMDSLFGVLGIIPLIICLRKIKVLERKEKEETERKLQYDLFIS